MTARNVAPSPRVWTEIGTIRSERVRQAALRSSAGLRHADGSNERHSRERVSLLQSIGVEDAHLASVLQSVENVRSGGYAKQKEEAGLGNEVHFTYVTKSASKARGTREVVILGGPGEHHSCAIGSKGKEVLTISSEAKLAQALFGSSVGQVLTIEPDCRGGKAFDIKITKIAIPLKAFAVQFPAIAEERAAA